MGQKKCPHCGEWSSWQVSVHDRCLHCGQALAGRDLEYYEKRQKELKTNEENWIFFIREKDPNWMKVLKKVGNVFYTIYIAILTFLAWLIAITPG